VRDSLSSINYMTKAGTQHIFEVAKQKVFDHNQEYFDLHSSQQDFKSAFRTNLRKCKILEAFPTSPSAQKPLPCFKPSPFSSNHTNQTSSLLSITPSKVAGERTEYKRVFGYHPEQFDYVHEHRRKRTSIKTHDSLQGKRPGCCLD